MKEGALEICDRAIKKWYSGEYATDEQMIQQNIQDWKRKREAVMAAVDQLKSQ